MDAVRRVSIGFCAAVVGSLVVFLMPIIVTMIGSLTSSAQFSDIASEPESRGFFLLYILVGYIVHIPAAAALGGLAYAFSRCAEKTVRVMFVLSGLMMIVSGGYFVRWFIGFPYAKYFPAILYVFVLSPLLLQGTLAFAEAHRHQDSSK